MRLITQKPEEMSLLLSGDSPLIVMIAPNFEERSLGVLHDLLSVQTALKLKDERVRPLKFAVVTLQGKGPHSFLDGIKASRTREALSLLAHEGFSSQVAHQIIGYPVEDGRLFKELGSLLSKVGSAQDLLVDFSAIPRNLLHKIIGAIVKGHFAPTVNREANITLGYCWADSYPTFRANELVGDIKGVTSRLDLETFLSGGSYCEVVVLAAGLAQDAFRCLSIAMNLSPTAEVQITLIFLMTNTNFRESWRQLGSHYGLLREISYRSLATFAFSVDEVLETVRSCCERAARYAVDGRDVRLALALFGPKPVMVGAHNLVERFIEDLRGTGKVPNVDLFNGSGTQYLSVYSLGISEVSLYRISSKASDLSDSSQASDQCAN